MSAWVCSTCNATNTDPATSCVSCGTPRAPQATGGAPPAGAGPNLGAPAFATASGATMAGPKPEPVVPSMVGGVLGGLVAAIGATALWFGVVAITNWQVGLVAIAVGWLVAQGVLFGAEGRASIPLVAVSAIFTLLALVVSEYLIIYHFVTQELQAIGVPASEVELFQSPDFVIEVVADSLSADPVTLLFWGIALFEAVALPFRKLAPAA